MELQEIDLFIDAKGEVRIEVRGVKGTQCLALTKELEAVLGAQIMSREFTPEAHEERADRATQQDRSGSSK